MQCRASIIVNRVGIYIVTVPTGGMKYFIDIARVATSSRFALVIKSFLHQPYRVGFDLVHTRRLRGVTCDEICSICWSCIHRDPSRVDVHEKRDSEHYWLEQELQKYNEKFLWWTNVCTHLPCRVDRVSEMKRQQLVGIDMKEWLFFVAVSNHEACFFNYSHSVQSNRTFSDWRRRVVMILLVEDLHVERGTYI